MGVYTQVQQIEIVQNARDLTASIQISKEELNKLRNQRYKSKPTEPVRKVLPQPQKIMPEYPPKPKSGLTYTEFITNYFAEDTKRYFIVLLLFSVFYILIPVSFYLYYKRCKEIREQIANSNEYTDAVKEAERIAQEKQNQADSKWKLDQAKLDEEYKKELNHYQTFVVPDYNKALAIWTEKQNKKIEIVEREILLNSDALEQLYSETKLISVTYRNLWILQWLYEDMSTSDHDIRYATELLDRDRQRKVTEYAGQMTTNAINHMEQTMRYGFEAVYNAIEDGNDIQNETLEVLSKARRDINIANTVATAQRHKTNKMVGDFHERAFNKNKSK